MADGHYPEGRKVPRSVTELAQMLDEYLSELARRLRDLLGDDLLGAREPVVRAALDGAALDRGAVERYLDGAVARLDEAARQA